MTRRTPSPEEARRLLRAILDDATAEALDAAAAFDVDAGWAAVAPKVEALARQRAAARPPAANDLIGFVELYHRLHRRAAAATRQSRGLDPTTVRVEVDGQSWDLHFSSDTTDDSVYLHVRRTWTGDGREPDVVMRVTIRFATSPVVERDVELPDATTQTLVLAPALFAEGDPEVTGVALLAR